MATNDGCAILADSLLAGWPFDKNQIVNISDGSWLCSSQCIEAYTSFGVPCDDIKQWKRVKTSSHNHKNNNYWCVVKIQIMWDQNQKRKRAEWKSRVVKLCKWSQIHTFATKLPSCVRAAHKHPFASELLSLVNICCGSLLSFSFATKPNQNQTDSTHPVNTCWVLFCRLYMRRYTYTTADSSLLNGIMLLSFFVAVFLFLSLYLLSLIWKWRLQWYHDTL